MKFSPLLLFICLKASGSFLMTLQYSRIWFSKSQLEKKSINRLWKRFTYPLAAILFCSLKNVYLKNGMANTIEMLYDVFYDANKGHFQTNYQFFQTVIFPMAIYKTTFLMQFLERILQNNGHINVLFNQSKRCLQCYNADEDVLHYPL